MGISFCIFYFAFCLLHSPILAADSPVFTSHRPPDSRPKFDIAKIRQAGIEQYKSQRLILWTDIDPEIAKTLPPLVDAAYEAWVKYFGPPLPDRDGAEYQLTGYLMKDRERFVDTGLLPREVAGFDHGANRGYEFWMNDQDLPYYRRHLLIHEATHCFMMTVPGPSPPLWYMEGMAEFFGTHAEATAGKPDFHVWPDRRENFVGFGRIELIQKEVAAKQALAATQVLALELADFQKTRREPYAWTWALCHFLDTHPRYQQRFRELGKHLERQEFLDQIQKNFSKDLPILEHDWQLFTHTLCYGYQFSAAIVDFQEGVLLAQGKSASLAVKPEIGWQSTKIAVESGRTYQIKATGRVTLAPGPKPWDSEPQGISIRYANGQPIGRLLGAVLSNSPDAEGHGTLWDVIPLDREARFKPSASGTFYLRVNDLWSELADNEGEYQVNVTARD